MVQPANDIDIDIRSHFYIDEVADAVIEAKAKSVALQFPDAELDYAPEVCMELEQALKDKGQADVLVYALADT